MISHIFKNFHYYLANILVFIILAAVALALVAPVWAADPPATSGSVNLRNTFDIAKDVAGGAGIDTEKTDLEPMVGRVISVVLSFMGIIFLVLMVYGGYLWMTDRGNEDQVKKAKNLIQAAVIGVIIIVAAYTISYYILERLGTQTLKSVN